MAHNRPKVRVPQEGRGVTGHNVYSFTSESPFQPTDGEDGEVESRGTLKDYPSPNPQRPWCGTPDARHPTPFQGGRWSQGLKGCYGPEEGGGRVSVASGLHDLRQ